MRKVFLLFFLFSFSFHARSQQVRPANSADIYKKLQTLKRLPKVLYLAAHPDDENTGLLSWLVQNQHIETAYLSLTRGDGGQNLIGSEQSAALGLIRTHELLEARKLDGAKQFFTRAIDFGFSKNPEDTFKQWDIDSITSDVVWVIRNFKPDVIICRFPPTAAAGHGQHAASAIIAEQAFKAAADSNAYTGQLTYAEPWQATRLLWNTFRFGDINTTDESQFKIVTGQYDPLLGLGYGELAGISRSLHQSQGAGTPSVAGIQTEHFKLVAGTPISNSLFDGIARTWSDKNYAHIDQAIDTIIDEFNFLQPDLSVPALLKLKKQISELDEIYPKQYKLTELNKIILSCAGFMAEAITNKDQITLEDTINVRLNIISRSQEPLVIKKIKWLTNETVENYRLRSDSLHTFNKVLKLPKDTKIPQAYWLKDPPENAGLYNVNDIRLLGSPTADSELKLHLTVQLKSEQFYISVPLSYKKLDPIKGDVVEALRVVPALDIKFSQPIYFLNNEPNLSVSLKLSANNDIEAGTLRIKSGKNTLYSQSGISIDRSQDTVIVASVSIANENQFVNNEIYAELEYNGNLFSKEHRLIEYNHIPTLQLFSEAKAYVIREKLNIKVTNVGYIKGAGDYIPDFLQLAGIQLHFLEESDMANIEKIASLDAIITGVRALNVEKRMKEWMPILNKYVKNGGTLVMQFNTLQELSTKDFGPFPFVISRDRVTEEDSYINFLNPNHALLNYPNKISSSDFEGWVQERGLYFPSSWSDFYEPLFEMSDTDEPPLKGGTLYARYGKGHYIYTPLSFFRQLPIGHSGAAKLFFNMLSIGK